MNQVLVVDDSPDLRALMRIALQGEGYEVLCAANGLEALEVLRERRPRFIILDLMMPEMNGVEFLDAKAKNAAIAGIPVIVCSAVAEANVACEGYLRKPVDLAALSAVGARFREEPAAAEPAG